MRQINSLKAWVRQVFGHSERSTQPSKQMQMGTPSATMQDLMLRLAKTQDVEWSCDEVHQVLDQFAEAQQRGEDVARLMPMVQQHLDMCPDCREEFEALLRILNANMA